jgi:ferredoxin
MRVSVDLDVCEANGVCVGIAPDVFDLDDDDVLHVLVSEPDADRWDKMREAAARCPKQAIKLTES